MMAIVLPEGEEAARTRDHVRTLIEIAQSHGADGKDAVIGALAGVREFVELQFTDETLGATRAEQCAEELDALAELFKS